MILVDTCVWSLALRHKRPADQKTVEQFSDLLKRETVRLIGPIRQEILSGIKTVEQYTKLKNYLRFFEDVPLMQEDFEIAASFFNLLRSKGVQGTQTDCLICSVSHRLHMPIFTVDEDFKHYQKLLPIAVL